MSKILINILLISLVKNLKVCEHINYIKSIKINNF